MSEFATMSFGYKSQAKELPTHDNAPPGRSWKKRILRGVLRYTTKSRAERQIRADDRQIFTRTVGTMIDGGPCTWSTRVGAEEIWIDATRVCNGLSLLNEECKLYSEWARFAVEFCLFKEFLLI